VNNARSSVLSARRTLPGSVADYVALTKPRIAFFVAFSAFVGGLVAAGPTGEIARVLEATLWITLSAAAASVFNQVLEREIDLRMERTRSRPLPAGRLSVGSAILFGTVLTAVAIVALALRFNVLSALLSLATLFLYVCVYTPLKRASTLNTVVGALPGAAPPLLGCVAVAGVPGNWGLALFAIVFVWQFPHFMAIAWLYRADYARAGLKMLPAIPGCERMAARAAFVHSLVLLPIVLLPGAWGDAGVVYCASALVLSLVYVAAAGRFALREDAPSARMLLAVSLAYLPLVLISILLDPVVGVGALH
jgi:protoheme IX farnesyltransferase